MSSSHAESLTKTGSSILDITTGFVCPPPLRTSHQKPKNNPNVSTGGDAIWFHDDARRAVPAEHDASGLQELRRRRRRRRAAEALQEPRGHCLLQGTTRCPILLFISSQTYLVLTYFPFIAHDIGIGVDEQKVIYQLSDSPLFT